MNLRVKKHLFVVGFSLLLLLSCNAWADEVAFSALQTKGCFGLGCTPSGSPSISELSFTGAAPSGTTSGGTLDLVLGTFKLVNSGPIWDVDAYLGTFSALVTFEQPIYIAGGQSTTFTALYIGGVAKLVGGVMLIDFGPTQHFTFSNDLYGGSFDLALDDICLAVGGVLTGGPYSDTANLVGHVTNASQTTTAAAVPEPSSILLLGMGLVSFAGLRRRF